MADPRRIVQNRSLIFGNGTSTVFQDSVVSGRRKSIEKKKKSIKFTKNKPQPTVHIIGFLLAFIRRVGHYLLLFPSFLFYRHIPFPLEHHSTYYTFLFILYQSFDFLSFLYFHSLVLLKALPLRGKVIGRFFHSLLLYPKIFFSLVWFGLKVRKGP